jgi:hypothetical protein
MQLAGLRLAPPFGHRHVMIGEICLNSGENYAVNLSEVLRSWFSLSNSLEIIAHVHGYILPLLPIVALLSNYSSLSCDLLFFSQIHSFLNLFSPTYIPSIA